MKGKLLILILTIIVVFAINDQAFGLQEGSTVQQQQLMGGLALVGFVGIYSMFIYVKKSKKYVYSCNNS